MVSAIQLQSIGTENNRKKANQKDNLVKNNLVGCGIRTSDFIISMMTVS